jgi:hypothetical protein
MLWRTARLSGWKCVDLEELSSTVNTSHIHKLQKELHELRQKFLSHHNPLYKMSHDIPGPGKQLNQNPQTQLTQPTNTVDPSILISRPIITPITPAILHRPDEKPDIILIMDSNGKFILENKLFPNKKVSKFWCPTIESAMELLTVAQLVSPSHIIIHTGINNRRAQQERVAYITNGSDRESLHHLPPCENSHIYPSLRRDFNPSLPGTACRYTELCPSRRQSKRPHAEIGTSQATLPSTTPSSIPPTTSLPCY